MADADIHLFGDTGGDGHGCDTTGLGASNFTKFGVSNLVQALGDCKNNEFDMKT